MGKHIPVQIPQNRSSLKRIKLWIFLYFSSVWVPAHQGQFNRTLTYVQKFWYGLRLEVKGHELPLAHRSGVCVKVLVPVSWWAPRRRIRTPPAEGCGIVLTQPLSPAEQQQRGLRRCSLCDVAPTLASARRGRAFRGWMHVARRLPGHRFRTLWRTFHYVLTKTVLHDLVHYDRSEYMLGQLSATTSPSFSSTAAKLTVL